MCPTCSLSIIYSFCENNCKYTKDTTKENLRVGDFFEIANCCVVKVLDIKDDYIIICVSKDILTVIRTFPLNATVPLSFKDKCTYTSIQIQITDINI